MTTRPSVLVTGANSGIGKEIVSHLARSGYDVAINYKVDAPSAEALAQELRAHGGRAVSLYADISVASEVDEMFRILLSEFGKLDALVNNAAIQIWRPLLEVADSDWDSVLATNLRGCFLCTQRAARHMIDRFAVIDKKDRRSGAIVNIGSGSNKVPFPNLSSYTASKGAIEMFTKSSAVELGPFGIRVNCVAPGAIDTDRTKAELPDFAGTWARLTPLRRIGAPADVAAAVEFLLSENASFISGQTLGGDGGILIKTCWPRSDYNS